MNKMTVQRQTCARIPTEFGQFQLCLYHNNHDRKEHMALVMGDVSQQDNVLTRVHSECFTGDVLGSRRCDCGQQLEQAMRQIGKKGQGVILYLRQEGRGIGLLDKLRAYNLQDDGYDTVEANLMLGHQADARDYTVAAAMLADLGVRSVQVMTNNPAKIESLQALDVVVTRRVPLPPQIHADNADYLATKAQRMRHLLNFPHTNGKNGHNGTAVTHARPFVTLSYAQSVDGSITAQPGQPTAISGSQSLILTHQLRRDHDAILVGIGTVLADDPRLTVRLVDGRNPQPIILDSRLRFPLAARLLQNDQPPWIATTHQADPARIAALEQAGATILKLPAGADGRIHLPSLLQTLAEKGIRRLMVEGGAAVITSFLAERLVDRVVLTLAPKLVGGLHAVNGLAQQANGHGLPRLHNPSYQWHGEDVVLFSDVVWERGAGSE